MPYKNSNEIYDEQMHNEQMHNEKMAMFILQQFVLHSQGYKYIRNTNGCSILL